MISLAQEGKLDIIVPPTAKLSTVVPAIQVVDLPFLFPDRATAHRVLDSVGIGLFNKLLQHDLIGVSFWESGFKQLTTSRPINTPQDFKNMRFRIMRSEVLRDQFQAWGAQTIAIDFAKTRQALMEKVVDGQENPVSTLFNMGFHEVQPYLTLTNHGYLSQVLIFSRKSFDRLPGNLQEILLQAGKEATTYERELAAAQEEQQLQVIRAGGTQVTTLSQSTRAALEQAVRPMIERQRINFGTEIIEQFRQGVEETRSFNEGELLIGLDADMAGNSAYSGLSIRRGIEIALEEINNAGGVLGKKLVLLARDNSMVSARGIDNIQRFSALPNLVAVFAGISSPVALSEIDLIHQKKLIMLDPWAAATDIVDNKHNPNFVFRVSVRDEYAAPFLLSEALKISDQVGILLANNGWGRSSYEAFTAELKKRNMEPIGVAWFDWGEQKHQEKIDRLYAAGAGVIIYVGNVLEGVEIVKNIAAREKRLPIISHWGITGGRFQEMAGDALTQIDLRVLQTFSFIKNNSPKARNVVNLYKKLYGVKSESEIIAPTGTAHAYDLTHMLAKAIAKAGSTDSDKIRHALESLGTYDGLVRTYNPPFRPDFHDGLRPDNLQLAVYRNGVLIPMDR